jgi:hypothetical protein
MTTPSTIGIVQYEARASCQEKYTHSMRIDPALCQKLLIMVEGDPKAGSGQFLTINVDGYEEKEVAHHIKYLWDTKLIKGQDVTHLSSPYPEIKVQDITPAGRSYLDENEPKQAGNKIGF